MKFFIGVMLMSVVHAQYTWDANGVTQIGECKGPKSLDHAKKAMCGEPLPVPCQVIGAPQVMPGNNETIYCEGNYVGSGSVYCPENGASEWDVQSFCTEISEDVRSDEAIENNDAIVNKGSAKEAARNARSNYFFSLREAVKRPVKNTYTVQERQDARSNAKKARREYFKQQRIQINFSWKDFVVEDTEDDEIYTESVNQKRQDRSIRYRLAPKTNCSEAEVLTLQPNSGALDSIDIEDGGCVKIRVEGEPGIITIEDKNEGDVEDTYELTCSLRNNTQLAIAGHVFTCGTREWDIGSVTTDTGCPAFAFFQNNVCQCEDEYVGVDTDGDANIDLCIEECDTGYVRPEGNFTFSKDACELSISFDGDGDGVPDAQEIIDGTDPEDNTSFNICTKSSIQGDRITYINSQCCTC